MENFSQFKEKVEQLENEILKHYEKYENEDVEEREIIRDGIVNEEIYFNSPIKILWILKEAYDTDNDGEGGWSLVKLLNDEAFLSKIGRSKATWYPIIYTTYAILNSFKKFDEIDDIPKKPEMADILKHVAFMNVQKFPGNTTSINSEISIAYKEHKNILLKQIKTYNPDVIIGGNTMWNFVTDLGLEKNLCNGGFDFWKKASKIYIDASHPSKEKSDSGKEAYVDEIVEIVKNNL